jgi:RNA polymerase sigma factor (sigma-70 family)
MAPSRLHNVVHHLRTLAGGEAEALPDGDLLARFAARREEAAFAALVQRHGPMVFGVCRRVLNSSHDAEDAWQATFLILARKAGTVRKQGSVASWLHGVALRVSSKVREREGRRAQAALPDDLPAEAAGDELTWGEVRRVLDEELQRLPERFRRPLVLCYLEGKTRDEAAGELGWSPTTFRGRLDTAREQLRRRLNRRGIALPAALLAAVLSQAAGASVLPLSRVDVTVRAAVAGTVPTALARLVEAGARTTTAKLALLVGMFAAISIGGGFYFGGSDRGPQGGAVLLAAEASPETPPAKDDARLPDDLLRKVLDSDRIVVYRRDKSNLSALKGDPGKIQMNLLPDLDATPLDNDNRQAYIFFLRALEEGHPSPRIAPITPKGWYVKHTPELEQQIRSAIPLPMVWGAKRPDGLRIGILPRKPRFAKGEDIVLDVWLQNTSAKYVTVQDQRYNVYDYWTTHFQVKTPAGETLKLAKPPRMFSEADTPQQHVLKPGEGTSRTVRLNRWPVTEPLRARTETLPAFEKPGTYTISAIYDAGGKATEPNYLTSAALAIDVTNGVPGGMTQQAAAMNVDRLQLSINLTPNEPLDADNPKYPLRYLMLNVLPVPIEPHARWKNGKPLGADARITKEQAARIVDALAKLDFFTTASPNEEDASRKAPSASLTLRWRPEEANETRSLRRLLDWGPLMALHLQAVRGCVDGPAAKALDEMLAQLSEERKKWDDELPLTKIRGRWELTGQEWNLQFWPAPMATSGECVIDGETVTIKVTSDQKGFRLPEQEFAGKIVPGGFAKAPGPRLDDPAGIAIPVKGTWALGQFRGQDAETKLIFDPKANTLKVASPAQATVYFVFGRKAPAVPVQKTEWGEPDNGIKTLLRAAKSVWKSDEAPELALNVYNGGPNALSLPRLPHCEVEVDGEWYTQRPAERPVAGYLELGPGKVAEDAARVILDVGERSTWIVNSPELILKRLRLTPGKHKVRVRCDLGPAKPVSNVLEIEIVDTRETGWGEPVEGLQLRGRLAAKNTWRTDNSPAFELGLRNRGDKTWGVTPIPQLTKIEIDGENYTNDGPIDVGIPVQQLRPGGVTDPWLTVAPDNKWLSRGPSKIPPTPLRWKPGKHKVRLSYRITPQVEVATKPFDVEIIDPNEVGWGEPAEGLQLRGRATKPVYNLGEKPVFVLDLWNRGAKTWNLSPDPSFAQLQVDGVWYASPQEYGFPPPPQDIKPDKQCDNWLTVAAGKQWFKRDDGLPPQPLEWKPGKHTLRLSLAVLPKSRLETAPFEVEIIDPKETGWGEPAEGLRLRGRATKASYPVGEHPTFILDVSNRGQKFWETKALPAFTEVEVNGSWYQHLDPAFGVEPVSVRKLAPGDQFDDWLTVKPRDAWNRRDADPDRSIPLAWKAGKYTVRLRYPFANQRQVGPVTEPIHFEIIDPKETGWGEPVEGLQLRGRVIDAAEKPGALPKLVLDLRNRGENVWQVPLRPDRIEIAVDGVWYGRDPITYTSLVRKTLDPGSELPAFLTVETAAEWASFHDKRTLGRASPTPLKWTPGRHQVQLRFSVPTRGNEIQVASAVFPVEVGGTDGKAWGEPVGGVRLRLRTDAVRFPPGEVPSFALDVRNGSNQAKDVSRVPEFAQVEIDGQWWYFAPLPDQCFSGALLPAGEQLDHACAVRLTPGLWRRIDQDWIGPTPLKLAPGKHALRVAYPAGMGNFHDLLEKLALELRGEMGTRNVEAAKSAIIAAIAEARAKKAIPVSNAVEFEIAGEDRTGWGAPTKGIELRGRFLGMGKNPGDPPIIALDLLNSGEKPWKGQLPTHADAIEVLIDGRWFTSLPEFFVSHAEKEVKPGEVLQSFLTVSTAREWGWFHAKNDGQEQLQWTQGRHQVQVCFTTGAAVRVTSGVFVVEIPSNVHATTSGFGEPVLGARLGAYPLKYRFTTDEKPTFVLDLRNEGNKDWLIPLDATAAEIELDGDCYRYRGKSPPDEIKKTVSNLEVLGHKEVKDFLRVTPERPWATGPDSAPKFLEWTPGRHTVRISYPVANGVRLVSEAIAVEVLDAKTAGWGEPSGGIRARLRPLKEKFAADAQPAFDFGLWNEGRDPVQLGRFAPLLEIEVDGLWYYYPIPDIGYPSDTLKPGEKLTRWVELRLANDGWRLKTPMEGVPAKLTLRPGKHTIRAAFPAFQGVNPVSEPVEFVIEEKKN